MKDYEHHPLADLFPLMSAAEIKDLAADIKERGLQLPITLFDGKILDGRHRQEACGIAKVPPRYEIYRGQDPMGFVLARNLHRRHLTESQRAMVAAKMETYKHGGDRKSTVENQDANLHLDRVKAAKTLDVSTRSVATASKILDASPVLAKEVENGKLSLHAAERTLKKADAKADAKDEPVLDEGGYPIPAELHALWARRGEVESMSREVAAIRTKFLALQATEDLLWKGFEAQRSAGFCENIHQALSAVRLFAVCVVCQGRGRKACTFCAGKGLISKFKWDTQASAEAKALRKASLKRAVA